MRTFQLAFFTLLGLVAFLAEAQESQKLVGDRDFGTSSQQGSLESGPAWTRSNPKVVHAEPLGSMIKLRCPAKGTPQPSISWQKDGLPIEQVQRPSNHKPYIQKPEKWELKIHGAMKSDEGTYTCIVSNRHGNIRLEHRVEIIQFLKDIPVLMEQSDNLTLIEGMDAHFYCHFEADLSMIVHWLRPAYDLRTTPGALVDGSNASHFEVLLNEEGYTLKGENLTILDVQPEDAGLYFCAAKTTSGITPGFFHLTVLHEEEAILQAPRNVTLEAGETAFFTCHTHGDIKNMISWVKLKDEMEGFVVLSEASDVLEIANVTFEDEGLYACVVGNERANVQAAAYLIVQEPVIGIAEDESDYITMAIIALALILLPLVVGIFVLLRKWKQEKAQKKNAMDRAKALSLWTKKIIIERENLSPDSPFLHPTVRIEKTRTSVNALTNRYRMNSQDNMTTITEYELPLDGPWEFPREQLFLDKVIGEGAFGKVMKGTAARILKGEDRTTVAVKMLKEGHTDQDIIDLVAEMDLMKMIGRHINIINLLGVCTQEGPLYVVVEFAEHGNLRDFLRKHADRHDGYERPNSSRPLISEKQLISFARQICKGMEYLSSMKCIHRDLAARNVLVAKDYVLKIADFGLARDVQKNEYYRKLSDGFLPIRWMAPESLFERRYTLQSDVWSFGVVLWEMMSLGASPYPDMQTVEQHFAFLRERKRLERPQNCPQDIYMIMLKCWNDDPLHRPTFSELVEYFDGLLAEAKEGVYLDLGEVASLASKTTGETLIAGTDVSTLSTTWTSEGQGWSSFGSASSSTAPQPPRLLPPLPSTSTSCRKHANSSGSSGLGSTEEIVYSPVVTSNPLAYFSNNIYGIQDQFSTFRPPLIEITTTTPNPPSVFPLCTNQYFSSENKMDEEDEEDEGINTMTPPKTPAEDYSKQFGDQMESSTL